MIMGDFNAHLKLLADTRQNQRLLWDFIDWNDLCNITSPSRNSWGPQYTFSTTSQTIVDYCIVDASLVSFSKDCTILGHHPLICPLSASLHWEVASKQPTVEPQKRLIWEKLSNTFINLPQSDSYIRINRSLE